MKDDLQKLKEMAGIREMTEDSYSIEVTDKHIIIRDETYSNPPRGGISMTIEQWEKLIKSYNQINRNREGPDLQRARQDWRR